MNCLEEKMNRILIVLATVVVLVLSGCTECGSEPNRQMGGIGPVTPGSYTTVTETASDAGGPLRYASLQCPSPTMPVASSDLCNMDLAILNVQARAIDGVAGGTYSPYTDGGRGVSITGGQGLEFTSVAGAINTSYGASWLGTYEFGLGDGTAQLNINSTAAVASSSGAEWQGNYQFVANSAIHINNNAGIVIDPGGSLYVGDGGTATSVAGATWTGTYVFGGTVKMAGVGSTLQTEGDVNLNGSNTVGGTTLINGLTTANNTITLIGDGHIRRRYYTTTGTSGTFTILTGDVLDLRPTSNASYAIGTGTAGEELDITARNASASWTIGVDYGTSTITLQNSAGNPVQIHLMHSGTAWQLIGKEVF